MPIHTLHYTPEVFGSMVDRVDPALHGPGMAEMIRNWKLIEGDWERDDGWKKINKTAAGTVRRWLGIFSYTDRNRTPHVIAVGDDGNIYHDLDWTTPVVYHGTGTWDGAWVASFFAWRDMAFICLLNPITGAAYSIRYDGITGEAHDVGLEAPTTDCIAVDNGAVNPGDVVPAGDYYIGYTFYDADNLWESGISPLEEVTVAVDNSTIGLTSIDTCAVAGRTIYRRLYWSTDGVNLFRVNPAVDAEIMDNVTEAYVLNEDELSTVAYVDRIAAGNYNSACLLPNGIVCWAGCADDNRPAMIYFSEDPDNPESLKLNADGTIYYAYAGHDDDPIVAAVAGRHACLIGKTRSVHKLDATCLECEGFLANVGMVSWASCQVLGTVFTWMSVNGPIMTVPVDNQDFSFVGSDPYRFDLSNLMRETVLRDRLRYCGSIHNPDRSTITWFVQTCASWPTAAGKHSDLAIVWEYGYRSKGYPQGVIHVRDLCIDYACQVPIEHSEEKEYWGAFPLGFIGELWDGQHGDGTDTMASATVLAVSADGKTVTIDESDVDASELDGDAFKGVVAYTTQFCILPIPACFRPGRTIIDHSQASALGRNLIFASDSGITVGQTIWFGGFHSCAIKNGLGAELPGKVKRFHYAEFYTKGS